jgi:hypothetical protein
LQPGSAYVFNLTGCGAACNEASKLTASDATAGDWFGSSVASSGSNVLVGARFGDGTVNNSGSAYLYIIATNQPPEVSTDQPSVTFNEGQTGTNTGTVSDPDGDTVTLSASVGTVTNNNDGTWSWSFNTSDGPAESQTVTIDADDGNGGTAQTTFEMIVNNVAPTVDTITVPANPIDINGQPVTGVNATFSDPAGTDDEPYTCTVDYGDGSGPQLGTVVGTTCNGPNQSFMEPGVYTVTVTVTDKDNDSGSATATEFIVIYDPAGGFVTGGGWINSPLGAYMPEPSLAGKATFGFVSKYKKGASIPTGNTEFQFKAGDLNFHSESYQWLIVNQGGANAQFKGEGTINGALDDNGNYYKFMLWAGDGDPDTFRIRIWWEDSDDVEYDIYDNGFDGSGYETGQPINGSIVIHKGK